MSPKHLADDWFSWPLPANVEVGERSWLHSSYAFIHYESRARIGLKVGHDTGIYHGTFFELGADAEVLIGSYCTLVGAIFATNGTVIIGDYALIAHEVVFADNPWPLPGGVRRESISQGRKQRARIDIGENVWIGPQAIVCGNVRIGDGAVVGAATLVTTDVPPFTLCAGNPMRIVRSF